MISEKTSVEVSVLDFVCYLHIKVGVLPIRIVKSYVSSVGHLLALRRPLMVSSFHPKGLSLPLGLAMLGYCP